MRVGLEHALDGGVIIAGLRQQLQTHLRLTLPFGAAVLVPGLDLRVGEGERRRQVHPVLDAEVFLPLETPLQLLQLVVGEGGASLARLLRLAVAVVVAGLVVIVGVVVIVIVVGVVVVVVVVGGRGVVGMEKVAFGRRILVVNVAHV